MFELKYENTKLLNVLQYNQVTLVLALFSSTFVFSKLALNYVKQVRLNH